MLVAGTISYWVKCSEGPMRRRTLFLPFLLFFPFQDKWWDIRKPSEHDVNEHSFLLLSLPPPFPLSLPSLLSCSLFYPHVLSSICLLSKPVLFLKHCFLRRVQRQGHRVPPAVSILCQSAGPTLRAQRTAHNFSAQKFQAAL